ncbi:hypothetical protein O181_123677 [Austropuccinia psidii MF-1]|uniref:Uncharacterized protein n=1 Tax=Austropuccinia psidii MF-1 TaxID=1389203 RepID=A0A9Q3KN59_9BASI|nr:hypothetical protein [Austropuccinia psidii MF-1]
MEEKEYEDNVFVPAPVGAFEGSGESALAQSDNRVSHQSEPLLLAILQWMTKIMANLQEASRTLAFKTPFMKALDCFD